MGPGVHCGPTFGRFSLSTVHACTESSFHTYLQSPLIAEARDCDSRVGAENNACGNHTIIVVVVVVGTVPTWATVVSGMGT